MPKRVVISLLGPVLDSGEGPYRWERWRPNVALCMHDDLLIDRFELLYGRKYTRFAAAIAEDMRGVAPESDIRPTLLEIADPWDFEQVYATLHDFARGYPFDVDNEEYLIHITTGTHVAQICLFLLTESRHLPGKLIQTSPPSERKRGTPGDYHIIDLDLSRYDAIASRFEREQRDALTFLKSGIETRNKSFNRLIERIEHVAIGSNEPILLMGPTGAGKSRLARRIFELKKSRKALAGDFVEVNSATIRGDAAMSALFGHTKGAFTGAVQGRDGLLRRADGGLLFLDEIGELGADEQAMLLRALEEKVFLPVGSDREVRSDFQLIAGTNRDLMDDVRAGRFRDDLLARINLWTFCLPGLRERVEDIEPNLDYELEQFARRTDRRVTFNKQARQRFLAFATAPDAAWTGNFRDLNAAVTRMATLAAGGRIPVEGVDEEIARLRLAWRGAMSGACDDALESVLGADRLADLDRYDRVQLADVVRLCRESRSLSDAGRKLFSASRQRRKKTNDADRLRKYLERFGLSWEHVQS